MKKSKKILLTIICTFIMMITFVGCGANNQNSNENKESASASYPMTVKDANGNEVTIPQKPENIVSLTLGTDEMLLSLVDDNRIKALSGKIAEDPAISNVADKAKKFDKAEGNMETVLSLNPDMVFAASFIKPEQLKQLQDAKIPVYCYPIANNIDEQKNVILDVAKVVGEEGKGKEIVAQMDKTLNEVNEKVKNLKDDEKVTVLSYAPDGSTYGKGSTFDDIVIKSGGINAAAKAGIDKWGNISKEKIVEVNPDVIILPSISYDKNKTPDQFLDEVKNDKSLATVNAIKNNRVYILPDKDMTSVSQYITNGVQELSKALYPNLFN